MVEGGGSRPETDPGDLGPGDDENAATRAEGTKSVTPDPVHGLPTQNIPNSRSKPRMVLMRAVRL